MITGSYKNGKMSSVFKRAFAIIMSLNMIFPNRGFAEEGDPIKNLPVPYRKSLPVPYEAKESANAHTGTDVDFVETMSGLKEYKLEKLSYQHVIDGKFPHRRFEAEVMGNEFYKNLGIEVGYDFKNNKKYVFGYYNSKVRVVVTDINPPPITFKSSMKAFAESMKTAGGAAKEAGKEVFSVRTPPTIVGFLAGMGAYAWGRAVWDPAGSPGGFSYSLDQYLTPLGVAGIGVFIAASHGANHLMVPGYLNNPTSFNRRMLMISSMYAGFMAQEIFLKLANDKDVKECYNAMFVKSNRATDNQIQVGRSMVEIDPVTLGLNKVAEVDSCGRVGEKFANGELLGGVLSSLVSMGVGFAMMEGAAFVGSKAAESATEFINAKKAKHGELGAALKDYLQRVRVQGKKFFMSSGSSELTFALKNYIPGVGVQRGIFMAFPRLVSLSPIGRVGLVAANLALFSAFTDLAVEILTPVVRGSIGGRNLMASETEMLMSYLRARENGFESNSLNDELRQKFKEYSATTKSWGEESNLELARSFNEWGYKMGAFTKEYMRTQQFYKGMFYKSMISKDDWTYPIFTANEDYLLQGYLSGRTIFGNPNLDGFRRDWIEGISRKIAFLTKNSQEFLIPGRSNAQLNFNAQLLSDSLAKFKMDQSKMANAKTLPEFHRKALLAQTADIASLIRWFSGFLKEYVEFQKERLFLSDPLFQRKGLRKAEAEARAAQASLKVSPSKVLGTASQLTSVAGIATNAVKIVHQLATGKETKVQQSIEPQAVQLFDPSNIEYLTLMSLMNLNPVIAPGRSFGLGIIAANGFYSEEDPGVDEDRYFSLSLGVKVGQVPVWSKVDYWVASMLCGPDTTKGESIIGASKISDYLRYGKPPTFIAPKFINGDTRTICNQSVSSTNIGLGDHLEQLHTPANMSKWSLVAPLENYRGSEKIPGIYFGKFNYNGQTHSSFVDVVQSDLSKLPAASGSQGEVEDHANSSFNERWGRLTEPQVRPLIKAWSRDYLQMLSEKHFSKNVLTDSYPMQMQQLSDNSVSMISYQRSLTALTLLNDMFTANSELPQSYFESGDGVGYSPAAKSFGIISSDVRAQVGRTVTIGQVFMYNWNKPEMNLGKILQPFNTAIQRNGDSEGLLKQFDKTPSDVLVVIRQVQQELKVLMSLGMRTAGADGIMIRPNCPPSELIVLKKSPLYVDRAEVESAKTNYSDRIKAIQRTKMGISSQHEKIANGLESLRKVIESNIAQMKGHRAALSKLGMMLFLINEIEEAGIDLAKIPLMQLLAYKSYLE